MSRIVSRLGQSVLRKRVNEFQFCRALGYSFEGKGKGRQQESSDFQAPTWLFGIVISGYLGYYFLGEDSLAGDKKNRHHAFSEQSKNDQLLEAGSFKTGLPLYSMEEVSKHVTKETGIWVVYREGVYDITDFVEAHPGGEQILIAAGGSVEPFWVLYGIHKNLHVFKILESLRVGNLKKEDIVQVSDVGDPYAKEPLRHAALKVANLKPFNAETPRSLLCDSFFTPNELFYVRNHLPVPEVDVETYRLEVEVEGTDKNLSLSLEDLKKLPQTSIVATLMCAGNRRADMNKVKPVKGLEWGPCAIGNATWTGVRLRDLLKLVQVTEDEERCKHVQFEGLDMDATANQYAASIPLWKAVDKRGDVILAYEMNGVPLPPDHGFPLKVVVPGVVGARNVKWLGRIIVSEKESPSHWQQFDYKGFSPSTDADSVDYSKSPSIQELPVISAVCRPNEGDTVKIEDGCISVKGYAWSGGGQKIVRVDLSVDGGKTWHVANFDAQDAAPPPQHWAWTLWSAKLPVNPASNHVEIWCKAVDSSYNTQPENFDNIWNFRGVLSNAYHRVKAKLAP